MVDMGHVMGELAATFEFELKSKRIELRIAERMPRLYVEKNRIRQVFQNLIDNAIKYMHRPHGGTIEITYDRVDGFHRFCVSDNGPGVAAGQEELIFQVFRRAEDVSAAEVSGKGVGLALIKSAMVNYEGRAWVESEPQKGARFFVTLDVNNTSQPESNTNNESSQREQPALYPVG